MTTRHSPNTPVTDYKLEALLYYHWLTFCNQFTEVQTIGVWSNLLSGTDGIISSSLSSTFQTTSSTFLNTHVGKYLAIRDSSNPINTTIAKIMTYNSPTSVGLNSPVTVFTANSTGVSFRIIDPTNMPAIGDYFVIQNPVLVNQPRWQARFSVEAANVAIQFAPIGGWRLSPAGWTLPTCITVVMPAVSVQAFMLADPDAGWLFLWTEATGGMASARNGVWLGSLSPFHAPRVLGTPSDESFAAIFGNVSGNAGAFNRSTGSDANLSVGQTMNYDNTIVKLYWAQKRLISSGTDTCTISGANPNPRSTEADDYDVIAFQRATNQALRGRVPGIRLLSEGLTNRTTISGGLTYCIDSGIGVSWNGKTAV
jgi:hypothetical protein